MSLAVSAPATARRPPLAISVALAVLAASVLATACAPLLGLDPYKQNLVAMLMPPSLQHPFGTDLLGRDMLARVVWGGIPPLFVGFAATIIAVPSPAWCWRC